MQVVSPKLQERAIERARLARWRRQAITAVEGYIAPYHSLVGKDGVLACVCVQVDAVKCSS